MFCAPPFFFLLCLRVVWEHLRYRSIRGGRCSPDIEHEIKEEKGRTVKNRAAVLLFRCMIQRFASACALCVRAMLALFLRSGSRIFFRIRMDFGVTSRSSSVSMYSMACSSDSSLCGTSFRASSAPEERVLVRCLVLQTFSYTSSGLLDSPMTMPEYTLSPGFTKRIPRS